MTPAPSAVGIPSDSRRSLWTLLLIGLVLLPAPFLIPLDRDSTSSTASSVIPAGHLAAMAGLSGGGGLTGYFTENRGEVRNREVQYYVTTGDLRVGMVPSGLLVEKLATGPDDPAGLNPVRSDAHPDGTDGEPPRKASLFRIAFEGSNRVAPQGRDALPFRTNYLEGHDSAAWHAGIASFRDVVYPDLYDGIDLVYHADAAGLKYEFLVRPGADPGRIRWSYKGVAGLQIRDGALIIRTDTGEIRDAPPIAYQAGRGVHCRYVLKGSSVGLACDAWDSARALTIDPLLYSTFLGGTLDSRGIAIAVDASGDAYVTGYTASVDFPTTTGAYQTIYAGSLWDAFVIKLNPSGTGRVYATFLGGTNSDRAFGIAVDGAGDATVAGYTNSSDFPTTPGAFRTTYSGGVMEAFVTKLNAAGNGLLYSTYLGGSLDDRAYAIALDASDDAFLAGRTKSSNFPVTPGSFQTTFKNTACGLSLCGHGFVAELNANGTALAYASFLGGTYSDRGLGVVVDAFGSAYVVGYTNSSDFPVTAGAFSTAFHEGACGTFTCSEAFVAKVNPAGTALMYATFLGGSKTDQGHGIAIDASGDAYVTGSTNSTDFPVTLGAYETAYPGSGNRHAFVTELNPSGSALVWSSFLGGTSSEHGQGVALDATGNVVVVGRTSSSDFPTTPGAVDPVFAGGLTNDAFVSELSAAGSQLLYSTFLGGTADDWGNAVALDGAGNAYITGHTQSPNFPTTPGAFRTAYAGRAEAFVGKLTLVLAPTIRITSPTSGAVATTSVTVTGTASHATLIRLRIGSAPWMNATGVSSWTATFDLSSFPTGSLVIQAVAYNGTLTSAPDSVTIQKTSTPPMMDRCTVRPAIVAIDVGGSQAFAAIGWNGTTELTGVAAMWSVTGGIGNVSSVGVFTASMAGSGAVDAAVTYGGRSAACSASITVTTTPPTVAIMSPSSGTNVTTATIVVRGTSTWATAVQVRAGTEPWVNATGSLSTWSATLDVSAFPIAQPFPVEARAFNGTVESTHDRVTLFKVLVVIVTIAYPVDHARVSGILTVTGTATSGSTVQVRFDSGPWRNLSAMGGTWTWVIDTTATFDGDHFLEAQAVLGSAASSIVSRDVVVSNPKPPWSIFFSPPLLYGVALAVVLVPLVVALGILARRRRRRAAASAGVRSR